VLSFSDSPQNLFNRLGRLAKVASVMRTYQSDQQTVLASGSDSVTAELAGEPDIQAVVGSAYIGVLNAAGGNVTGLLQGTAEDVINRMVFRDNPRINQTLTEANLLASILEAIRQMGVAGATVQANTVSANVGAFTGVGNGQVVCSVIRPLDGRTLENSFSENVSVVVTADSYADGATASNETLAVVGTGSVNDVFAFNWPLGSNAQTNVQAINGAADASEGNELTNSGFEDWTSNVPDNWDLEVGVAGTDISEESTIVYDPEDGGKSLKITGDGATLVKLTQKFDDSAGTVTELDPFTQHSVCLWVRRDGLAPSAGVLTIDLADGDGNVINDQAGTANSFDVDLTTLSTNFAAFTGAFRTPLVMPDELYLRLRLSTALESGRSVYVDRLGMGEMAQLYTSGPFFSVHSGNTLFQSGDYATVAVSNNRSLDSWQTAFLRLFFDTVLNQEILLPSSSVPTIADTLITRAS
jgi:hypothetical protein